MDVANGDQLLSEGKGLGVKVIIRLSFHHGFFCPRTSWM